MKFLRYLLANAILGIIFVVLMGSTIGVIIGSSLMISTWYSDRNIIDDIATLEYAQTNFFDSELFEQTIKNFKDSSNSFSEVYSLGYTLFLISFIITIGLGIFVIKYHRTFDQILGTALRLKLSSTSLAIIFSIMFAISLIFISSVSFIVISKNQTIIFMLSHLVNSTKIPQIEQILEQTLQTTHLDVFINIFNAAYSGLVGFTLLLAKIIQFMNNDRPHMLAESFIFAAFLSFLFWILIFLIFIGIDPSPSIPKPDIGLKLFGT